MFLYTFDIITCYVPKTFVLTLIMRLMLTTKNKGKKNDDDDNEADANNKK